MKILGLTQRRHPILLNLSSIGEWGIPSVAVKCADIRRNTGGEGATLDRH